MLMLLLLLLCIFFISSMQPMFMISMLIIIMLMYSYLMYFVLNNYWFSYALIMVMLSGMLVVFTYMASLIPNESFEEYNLLYMFSLMIFIFSSFFIFMYYNKCSMMSLMLWGSFFGSFNIFMVSFLLMIMLLVVWMSYFGYGALRT